MAVKKIYVKKLRVGMTIALPVYVLKNNRHVLLLPGNTLISNEDQIRHLYNSGVTTVEIDTDKGIDTFLTLLKQKKWEDVSKSLDENVSKSLLERHTYTFTSAFTSVITKNAAMRFFIGEENVSLILKEILQKIQNNSDLLMALIRLKSTNEYIFTHSIYVSVMCIYIARSLGFSFTDITRFGLGALISDIGMANFPSSLISRPSGFSYKEKEEIQKHPLYSVEFCKKIGIEDILIETLIMQHHERFDGSGYPYGLKGDEIHPISRLFTITDVYIAMTSNRPHRAGFPPHMVLGDILRLSGTLFDPKMSEIFIRQIGVFPIGNMVELTSGHYALVASPNKHDPLRPIVILFTTKKKLSTPERLKSGNDTLVTISRGQRELIDLSKDEKYGKIKRGVDHRKFRINPDNYFDKI